MWFRIVLVAAFALALSASAEAQMPPNQRPGQPVVGRQQPMPAQPVPVEISGALINVVPNGVVVLDSSSKSWQVAVPATAKVHVHGTALADYLDNGMVVEFKGEVDDQRSLTDKVDELTIVSANTPLGVFPPDSSRDLDSGIGGPGDFVGKPAKRGKGIAAGSYRIVGKLSVARNGKLAVQIDRDKLGFELTEQPTISIDVNDTSLIARGDKITVKGVTMPNTTGRPQPNEQMVGRAQALEVKVELSEQLGSANPKKKKISSAKTEAKKSTKPSKKDENDNW